MPRPYQLPFFQSKKYNQWESLALKYDSLEMGLGG